LRLGIIEGDVMKIFLSWHGTRSRAIAEALNDWLPRVIQAVKPFFSPEMKKGAKWSNEIDSALEGTRFGIVCLTPDNLQSIWIHYETGALSRTNDAIIWTLLQGLKFEDVPPPLGKFQHTLAQKDDVLRLMRSINKRLGEAGGEALDDRLMTDSFDAYWPQLEEQLTRAETVSMTEEITPETAVEAPRDSRDILGEILELARNQERRLSAIEGRFAGPAASSSPSPSPAYKNDFYKEITLRLAVDEPDPSTLVETLSKGFQMFIPGTRIGLKDVNDSLVQLTVNFPYPVDEDYVDEVLQKVKQQLGIRIGGYSSSPAW